MRVMERDCTGEVFGRLTVLEKSDIKNNHREYKWKCRCVCGNIVYITKSSLTSGSTKSCGCWRMERDCTGEVFGRLTVLEKSDIKNNHQNYKWKCRCVCGNIVYIIKSSLTSGSTKSCGCWKKEVTLSKFSGTIILEKGMSTRYQSVNQVFRNYKKSSKRREQDYSLSDEKTLDLMSLPCDHCGKKPETLYRLPDGEFIALNGLDRIDNKLGYTEDNVVPSCSKCNMLRGLFSVEQFYEAVDNVAKHKGFG